MTNEAAPTELSGSYESSDHRTSYTWAMPDYSDIQRAACRVGGHIASRKVVVKGWVSYFSQVKRAYCACGSKCWIWFESGWVDQQDGKPGDHLAWIESQVESERMRAEWEVTA